MIMLKKMAHLINNSPVSVVGVIVALHTLFYGLGFVFQVPGFQQTAIFDQVNELMNPSLFGAFALFVGVASILGWLTRRPDIIRWTTTIQVLFWLFITILYVLAGFPILALVAGIFWVMLAAYMGYIFANKVYTRYDNE